MVVGFPLFDRVTLVDFVGATQIFSEAEGFTPMWLAPEIRPYETTEKTLYQQPICITPQFTFRDRPKIDILFCPGGNAGYYDESRGGGPGYVGAMLDGDNPNGYQQFVRDVSQEADWCGSVCTGAFILAAAGLFDDCTATTYWSVIEELRRFPRIRVPDNYPRALIERSKGRFSGGGVSSSLDLALALVNEIADERVAATAQLVAQYSPDPIINFGDPACASQGMVEESELVKEERRKQETGIIEPTRAAVTKVLETIGEDISQT